MKFLRSRWFYFWVAIIGLPIAWYFWISGWIAERRWDAYVAESRARGVKWTRAEFLPAPLRPEEDLAQLPVFTGTEKWAGLLYKVPARECWRIHETERQMNWSLIREIIQKRDRLIVPLENDALRACDGALRQLQELVDLLATSRAEVGNFKSGQYLETEDCIRLLWLRCHLDLAMHRSDETKQTLNALLRFSRALQSMPQTILDYGSSDYLGDEGSQMARHILVAGLDTGAFTDDLLRHCIEKFRNTEYMEALVWRLGLERALFHENVEVVIVAPDFELIHWRSDPGELFEQIGTYLERHRRSWRRPKQLWLEHSRDELLSMIDVEHQRWIPVARRFDPEARQFSKPDFDGMEAYRFWTAARVAIFNHAQDRMAALACALELYRRKIGSYPASLEQLEPEYVPKLPHDPASGRAFIYRSQADGSYLLYSVGFDGADQGGTTAGNVITGDQAEDWRWQSPTIERESSPK